MKYRLTTNKKKLFSCKYYLLGLSLFMIFSLTVNAGPREQAKRIHDRLVGVPPTAQVLNSMAEKISQGDPIAAAYEAIDNKLFYTVTLKNFVTPWTNEAQSVFEPLNDFSATIIGIVRDDIPFTEILSSDIVYIAAADQITTPYSQIDNLHYQEIEENQVDLSDVTKFYSVAQSSLIDSQILPNETAGIITTRAFGKAFFSGGTNRIAWRFLAVDQLCGDLESFLDITLTPDRIRQDVSRSPGGDSSIYLNSCIGCHTGMDPFSQAFAYFNYDEELTRVIHTPGQVQAKYLINAGTFPQGFVTTDNRWDNYWRNGKNASLNWRGTESGGFGAKSLGQEVANSRAFSECKVKQVFKKVCYRTPVTIADQQQVSRIADVFELNNYSMKRVFAEVATTCMSE